jgi:hypothetical protein
MSASNNSPPDRFPPVAAALPTSCHCTLKPRVRPADRTEIETNGTGEDDRGRSPIGWGRWERSEEGGGKREEGGEAAELHLFRPPPSSIGSERNLRRTKRWASFPNHLGASGVGNERGSGWNSGTPEGIQTEFQTQIPHPSKRWNSGPNSTIPNS